MSAAAILLGKDYTETGEIAVRELGPSVAIAISRGLHPKRYWYRDPNEDAVAAIVGSRATLLVAIDGHRGFTSTEVLMEHVLAFAGSDPPGVEIGDEELADFLWEGSEAIRRVTGAAGAPAEQAQSRAALTLALVGEGQVRWATMGDAPLLVASASECERIAGWGERTFMGWPMDREEAEEAMEIGRSPLAAGEWVIAASDGYTDFAGGLGGGFGAVTRDAISAAETAAGLADSLIRHAFLGGAGDNVAVALAGPT